MYGVCFGALLACLVSWSAALMSNMAGCLGLDRRVSQWAEAGRLRMQSSRPPIGSWGDRAVCWTGHTRSVAATRSASCGSTGLR